MTTKQIEESLIQETNEYDVFKRHPGNRPIDMNLVSKLEESIRKKNLLKARPILVDKDFNIIDGQHRHEACRRNGWPIHFYIADEIELEDMKLINIAQKSWSIPQFVNYYANVEGKEDYLKLERFCLKEDLKVNVALSVLNNDRSSDFYTNVKEGKYQFPEGKDLEESMIRHENIKSCIDYLRKTMPGAKTFLRNVTFYTALLDFFNVKSFVYDTFMKKLSMKLDLMRHCTTRGDYVKLFTTIYNWKNSSPIREEMFQD